MARWTPPQVAFNWWIEPETDIRPEDSFEDNEAIRTVREWMREGVESAWCMAFVTAGFEFELDEGETVKFDGGDSVGGMSWESEKQLWKDNLEDMKISALADLFAKIRLTITEGFRPMRIAAVATQNDRDRLAVALDWMLENEGAIIADKWRRR